MVLLRNELKKLDFHDQNNTRLQFSESMLKTIDLQKNSSKICVWCCWNYENDDKNMADLLTSEIDGLKSLVKEKEEIIKDLTDRLITGSDQLRDYFLYGHVTSKTKNRRDRDEPIPSIPLPRVLSSGTPACTRSVEDDSAKGDAGISREGDSRVRCGNSFCSNGEMEFANRLKLSSRSADKDSAKEATRRIDCDPITGEECFCRFNCERFESKTSQGTDIWKVEDERLNDKKRFENFDFEYSSDEDDSCSSCSCVMQLDEHFCCYDNVRENIQGMRNKRAGVHVYNVSAENASSGNQTTSNKLTTSVDILEHYANQIGFTNNNGLLLSVPALMSYKNNDRYKINKPNSSRNDYQIASNSRKIINRKIPFEGSTQSSDPNNLERKKDFKKIGYFVKTGSNSLTSRADSAFENETISSYETYKTRRNRSASTIETTADIHSNKAQRPDLNQKSSFEISSDLIGSPYFLQRRSNSNSSKNIRSIFNGNDLIEGEKDDTKPLREDRGKEVRTKLTNESQLTIASM